MIYVDVSRPNHASIHRRVKGVRKEDTLLGHVNINKENITSGATKKLKVGTKHKEVRTQANVTKINQLSVENVLIELIVAVLSLSFLKISFIC